MERNNAIWGLDVLVCSQMWRDLGSAADKNAWSSCSRATRQVLPRVRPADYYSVVGASPLVNPNIEKHFAAASAERLYLLQHPPRVRESVLGNANPVEGDPLDSFFHANP